MFFSVLSLLGFFFFYFSLSLAYIHHATYVFDEALNLFVDVLDGFLEPENTSKYFSMKLLRLSGRFIPFLCSRRYFDLSSFYNQPVSTSRANRLYRSTCEFWPRLVSICRTFLNSLVI